MLGSRLSVVVLEKTAALGGSNSAKASSGLSALTVASGDSEELFMKDTMSSGDGFSDETLVRKLVDESADALSFLESFGVELTMLSQCGAHAVARTHRNPTGPNVGTAIMRALTAAAIADEQIEIVSGARVLELLPADTNEPQTRGVRGVAYTDGVERREVVSDAVVLATGGFAASAEKLALWAPAMAALPTTNGPTAEGEGVAMGLAVGASAVDLERVQVHPTAIVDPADPGARTKWLGPEALRGSGGVLLSAAGRRFVDELAKRSVVTAAIWALTPAERVRVNLVLGEDASAAFGLDTLGVYASKGLVTRLDGFAALATHLRTDETALRAEAAAYDDAAATGGADDFGKTVFPSVFGRRGCASDARSGADSGGSFHVFEVTPALHYCMGGLKIGADAAVLATRAPPEGGDDALSGFAPIRGLFAAGEVTGGVHGANRLAGNSLLECVVFGRTAGQAAVRAAFASGVPDSQRQ
jgi:flavocytochrome c